MTKHRRVLFHPFGPFPFLLQLGKGERFLHCGLPTSERVGQENAGPLIAIFRQRGVQFLHGEADLQVGDHEGGLA